MTGPQCRHLGRARGPWGSTADLFVKANQVFVLVTSPDGKTTTRQDFDELSEADRFMCDCETVNAYTTGWLAVKQRLTLSEDKQNPDWGVALATACHLPIGSPEWLRMCAATLQLLHGAQDAHGRDFPAA